MLYFDTVSKRYPATSALSRVSLRVAAGEMVFLTGRSGAGKSTLLKIAAMLEPATQGTIVVNGKNIARLTSKQIPLLRQQMGLILQQPHLLPQHTVFANVALPLNIAAKSRDEITERVHTALEIVGLLDKTSLLPPMLSAGEQRRVEIARAIVHQPSVILADEPTANLDQRTAITILQLFVALNKVGVTILLATHDLMLIAAMPYRILTLKRGVLVNG